MEARSPIQMLADKGWWEAISYYTPIGLLVPLLIPVYIYRGWQTRDGVQLFLSVMVVFGVLLLLVQFRLHYFGSFALILGWVLLVSEKLDVSNRKPLLTFGVGLLVLALAFQPAAKDKLFIKYALGLDPGYQDVYTLFAPLAERCRKNPGIALADNNFGHYIRFHTECTVIANNFLMTPQHEEKIAVMEHLLELSPEELLEEAPEDTRYVFSRMLKFYGIRNGEAALTSTEYVKENTPRLYFELNSRDDLPERFRVVGELPLDSSRGLTRARVVEILPARGVGDD
jgi:hypothetical protein